MVANSNSLFLTCFENLGLFPFNPFLTTNFVGGFTFSYSKSMTLACLRVGSKKKLPFNLYLLVALVILLLRDDEKGGISGTSCCNSSPCCNYSCWKTDEEVTFLPLVSLIDCSLCGSSLYKSCATLGFVEGEASSNNLFLFIALVSLFRCSIFSIILVSFSYDL